MSEANEVDGVVMRFRIYGEGIFSFNQPRFSTAKEARDNIKAHADKVGQSWLYFKVIEDLPDGTYRDA